MEFAIFLGCNIPVRLKHYETASRAVLQEFGVRLVDIHEFNCCGYPLRNIDLKAFVLSSARNMALAEKQNLNILVLCKCGYGTFRMAEHLIKESTALRDEVNRILGKEGLKYEGDTQVKHILSVLYKDVGIEGIKEKVTRPYENMRIATHYGCHALRPSSIVQFDDPVAPSLFDQLVEVTGAESVEWPEKLECCGAPLLGTNDGISRGFTEKKLAGAKRAGSHYLTTGCPFCQIQFDTVQQMITSEGGTNHYVPAILYPQLLGPSLGIDKTRLGLQDIETGTTVAENYLGE